VLTEVPGPKDDAPVSGQFFIHQTWELTGEGDYEGLTMELYRSLHDFNKGPMSVHGWGVIVPTDDVPPFPEIPEAAPADG
jgi:hypothetical protein